MPDVRSTAMEEAFHLGLGVDIGVRDLPPADVEGTSNLPPVFTSLTPLDPATTDDWARVGYAIAADHRLYPEPLAQAGLAEMCSCGEPGPLCRVRRLLHRYGLIAP